MKYMILFAAAVVMFLHNVCGAASVGNICHFAAACVFANDLLIIASDWIVKLQSRMETA